MFGDTFRGCYYVNEISGINERIGTMINGRKATLKMFSNDMFSIETVNEEGSVVNFMIDRKDFDKIVILTDPDSLNSRMDIGRYEKHGITVNNQGKTKFIRLDNSVFDKIELIKATL
jgi:hypothetical protein